MQAVSSDRLEQCLIVNVFHRRDYFTQNSSFPSISSYQRIATTGGKATPSAHEWASFEQVADRVAALQLSREHARGVTLHAVAHRLLLREVPSVEAALTMPAFPATPLDLFCRCSKPAFLRNLVAAGGKQLVAELLAEHKAAAATVNAADAERTVASTGADGGTVVHRVHDVATTLSCGTCNRRHYITAADLSAVSL
jgi:hypothetical protein